MDDVSGGLASSPSETILESTNLNVSLRRESGHTDPPPAIMVPARATSRVPEPELVVRKVPRDDGGRAGRAQALDVQISVCVSKPPPSIVIPEGLGWSRGPDGGSCVGEQVHPSPSPVLEVNLLRNSILGACNRVLGTYNPAYVRSRADPPFRVRNNFNFARKEIVRLPEGFVAYYTWSSKVSSEANLRGDEAKILAKERVRKVQAESWSLLKVATKLGCSVPKLEVILDSVRDLDIPNPLQLLALLPPEAAYPSVPMQQSTTRVSLDFLLKEKLILPPVIESEPLQPRASPRGCHPKGLERWPLSDTLTESGLLKWNSLKQSLKDVNDALTSSPVSEFVPRASVWISESLDMQPFVHGYPVSIADDGTCTWMNVSTKPLPRFISAVAFMKDEIKKAEELSIPILDHETVSHIEFGFRLDNVHLARGIYVAFPTEKVYKKLILMRMNSAASDLMKDANFSLMILPSSTLSRVHSCSVVAKANTTEVRLIKNM